MIFNKNTAKKTAEVLLHINAIKLSPNAPFTWASGWKSPIYCDNRLVLSYPAIRNYIKSELAKNIENLYGKPDVIAGVATGAIGIGALVADDLTYGFERSKTNFEEKNIELHTLSNYEALLEQALDTGFINDKELNVLSQWNSNPSEWDIR